MLFFFHVRTDWDSLALQYIITDFLGFLFWSILFVRQNNNHLHAHIYRYRNKIQYIYISIHEYILSHKYNIYYF